MAASQLIFLVAGSLGWARRPATPTTVRVPTIETVVEAEGFTPTPSQSEMYRPGAVLVPNTRGGHDVVVADCIEIDPSIAIMSQSSIATTLSAGVSARLTAVRGEVNAGIEKRLSFVDPEQRTISLGQLRPTDRCVSEVQTAAQLQDLTGAVVLHDVLVAIVQNTVCTKADASGRVIALGEAEAAAYSECVQESDAQVPLGYKALPLAKVLAVVDAPAPGSMPTSAPASPAAATSSVNFGTVGGLGVEAKLKEQACADQARAKGQAARQARLDAAALDARTKATASWNQLAGEANACTKLKRADRGACIDAVEQWLAVARKMPVQLAQGVENVQTDCGQREAVFAAERMSVAAKEVAAAEELLKRLKASDPRPSAATDAGSGFGAGLGVLSMDDVFTEANKSEAYRQMAREKRHASIKFLADIIENRNPQGMQRAEMMLRLAELYFEEGEDLAHYGKPDASKWYEQASVLYDQIISKYPAYQRADQARYFQGQVLEELGRRSDATTAYKNLVRSYSQSTYRAESYARIGEYYFDQNNVYKALNAYMQASKYKDSPYYGFTLYKLAWCYHYVGEHGKAIETMKGAYSAQSKKDNLKLKEGILAGLLKLFADAGEVEAGKVYFRQVGAPELANKL